MTTTYRGALGAALLGAIATIACNGAQTAKSGATKEDYDKAIESLTEPIALISAYQPHLTEPPPIKYPPKRRSNVDEAMWQAADEIRHACNRARQMGNRTGSTVAKSLEQPFLEVAKACAAPEEPDDVERCKKAVLKLDTQLAETAAASMAAGVTKKFPRIAPETVTDKAKKKIAPYLSAKGPTKTEKEYWALRAKQDTTVQELIMACRAAEGEANTVMLGFEKTDETLHKLAAKHKIAVEAECNRLNYVANTQDGITKCREEPDKPPPKRTKEEKEEFEKLCKLNCANGRKIVADGVPAAVFTKMKDEYDEICPDWVDEKKKDKDKDKDEG